MAASDAFFPFADGLKLIAEAGATAVIQPGGSLRDDEVIAAADAAGLAMVFTGHAPFPALDLPASAYDPKRTWDGAAYRHKPPRPSF